MCFLDYRLTKKLVGAPLYFYSSNIHIWTSIASVVTEVYSIVKGRHAQVGLITSNLWLVLLSFVHCMSVVPVAMYCRIECCVSQLQSALAF